MSGAHVSREEGPQGYTFSRRGLAPFTWPTVDLGSPAMVVLCLPHTWLSLGPQMTCEQPLTWGGTCAAPASTGLMLGPDHPAKCSTPAQGPSVLSASFPFAPGSVGCWARTQDRRALSWGDLELYPQPWLWACPGGTGVGSLSSELPPAGTVHAWADTPWAVPPWVTLGLRGLCCPGSPGWASLGSAQPALCLLVALEVCKPPSAAG